MRIAAGSTTDVIVLSAVIARIPTDLDFGDAPAAYEAGAPASHVVNAGTLRLGSAVDVDPIENPTADAGGDDVDGSDDDDALSTAAISHSGGSASATITLDGVPVGGATVCGWIDFNADSSWASNERQCETVSSGSTSVVITWSVPSDAVDGPTFMRLRLALDSGEASSPTGTATSGEVEDHAVTVTVAAPPPLPPSDPPT